MTTHTASALMTDEFVSVYPGDVYRAVLELNAPSVDIYGREVRVILPPVTCSLSLSPSARLAQTMRGKMLGTWWDVGC